jgi:mRNA-degrading endonuclease toxin of MazEF toxin-antitoxin module
LVLAAPATTTQRGLATEVRLDECDGAPRECVLDLDAPEPISRASLVEFIVSLSDSKMSEVCLAMARAVDCVTR